MKIEEISGKKIAIHCATEGESIEICCMFPDADKKWLAGTMWRWYGEKTCYDMEDGTSSYENIDYYKSMGFEIIPASEIINS